MSEWTMNPAIEWLEDSKNYNTHGTYIRQIIQEIEDMVPEERHACLRGVSTDCMTGEWHYSPDMEIDLDMWISDAAFVSVGTANQIRERRAKDCLAFVPLEMP